MKISVKRAFASLFLMISAAAGGPAHAQFVNSFTPENVSARLVALGIPNPQVLTTESAEGTLRAVVFDWQGNQHIALLRICKASIAGAAVDCFGLNLATLWRDVKNIDPADFNAFNADHDFGKAFYSGETAFFTRYLISDGGVSTVNIDSNIANFLSMSRKFDSRLSSRATKVSAIAGEGASRDPGDEALVAAFLEVLDLAPPLRVDVATKDEASSYAPVLLHDDRD